MGPSLRLSWSVPGAWGRSWGGCRGGSRAAAIQLSTAFSHGGKARLLKASNRVASRGQIQAAKQKGSVGILCSPWGFGWGGVGEVITRCLPACPRPTKRGLGEVKNGGTEGFGLPLAFWFRRLETGVRTARRNHGGGAGTPHPAHPSSESRECRKLRGQNESGASHRDQRRGAGIRRALTQSFPISRVGDTGGRRDPPAPAASTGRRQHRHPKASGTQEFGIAKWDLRPIAPTQGCIVWWGAGGHPSIQPGKLGCEPKPSWRARAESV